MSSSMKRADLYTMYEIIHLMRLHKNLIKNVNQSNVREHDARPTNDDERLNATMMT